MNQNHPQAKSSRYQPAANKSELYTEKEPQSKQQIQLTAAKEELRQIPMSVAQTFATEVVGGVLDGFMRQLLGQPVVTTEVARQPTTAPNQEALMWKRRFQFAEQRRQEEIFLMRRKEQETNQRIMTIRRELKMQVTTMSQEMAAWSKEVEIATFQAPVAPSIYHENFFEKLLSFVKNLRKSVSQSRLWLAVNNAKATQKKAKGLWGMAQTKKGNTYNQEILFSGERAVSMSG